VPNLPRPTRGFTDLAIFTPTDERANWQTQVLTILHRDEGGIWWHKLGYAPATNRDEQNRPFGHDPRNAYFGRFIGQEGRRSFVGFFRVPNGFDRANINQMVRLGLLTQRPVPTCRPAGL